MKETKTVKLIKLEMLGSSDEYPCYGWFVETKEGIRFVMEVEDEKTKSKNT